MRENPHSFSLYPAGSAAGTFQAVHPNHGETDKPHLRRQLLGAMKVGRREVIESLRRIAVLTVPRSCSTIDANRESCRRSV